MRDLSNLEPETEIEEAEESSVLLSIGDLMSGLLMFFALLFITVQIQLNEKVAELNEKLARIEKLERELVTYRKAFEALPQIIVKTLEGKLGGKDIFTVDPETGDVSVRDRILFDENSAALKPEGKKFLQSFIPLYSRVIFSDKKFEDQIAKVAIEGHTSSKGTEEENLNLSLRRAESVINYILSNEVNFPTKSKFKAKILAAGRGEIDAKQNRDEPSDRKVVFRFQFRRETLKNLNLGNR
ncbi:MAG TPA: chemotaxis protein MotB [Cyanobacteria bacterium UBA11372]|nr:chemotaxis protein MotB [Cyanobacteria bacterium UBA11372]